MAVQRNERATLGLELGEQILCKSHLFLDAGHSILKLKPSAHSHGSSPRLLLLNTTLDNANNTTNVAIEDVKMNNELDETSSPSLFIV